MKKKMDFITKAKLIYSGELLIFAIAFITLAILRFVGVIQYGEMRATIFNWVTLFGGSWILIDLCWALFDKKRRQRVALIDKIIHAPAGLYLISFDLYCLITQTKDPVISQYGISIVLAYLGLCYTFEAFYHFKYPVPGLVAIEEEEKQNSSETPIEEFDYTAKEDGALLENKVDSSKEESEEINHDQEK